LTPLSASVAPSGELRPNFSEVFTTSRLNSYLLLLNGRHQGNVLSNHFENRKQLPRLGWIPFNFENSQPGQK
jgi:hypothetical protein